MSTNSAFARALLAFTSAGLMAAPSLAQIGTATSSGATHRAVGAESLDPRTVPEWVIEPMGAWGGPVHAFERHGDIGYVGSGQRLVILDMSDLTDITELGTIKLGSTVQDFKVREGLAYVATIRVGGGTREEMGIRHSGFHVVDVSDVNAPEVIWSDLTNEGFVEVDLWGDIAFVREYGGTIWAADLTDQRAPVMTAQPQGSVQFRNAAGNAMKLNDLEIHGDLAYMAVQESLHQFQIFDLSTITPGVWPALPQRLGTANFFIQREARKVAVEGDWAYVLGRDNFVLAGIQDEAPGEIIWAVNVSNPAAPVKHGSHFGGFANYVGGWAGNQAKPVYDLSLSGGRLYAADGASIASLNAWDLAPGVVVLDVSTDPGQPTQIGTHRTRGSARGVVADDEAVYLFDLGEGLMVMDTTDPAAFVKVGGYHSPAKVWDSTQDGDRLYLADPWNGLSILDISDTARPLLLGVYQSPERLGLGTSGLDLDENGLVYLAAGRAGMEVIDASDAANPILVSAIRFPAENWVAANGLVVDRLPGSPSRVAYIPILVGNTRHFFSIDISNPASPLQADLSPPTITGAEKIARYAPGRFLLADGAYWLHDVDGSDPHDLNISMLPSGPFQKYFTSVTYNEATSLVSATYNSQHDGSWFVTFDIGDVRDESELGSKPMHRLGDVESHPLGAVVLGQWTSDTPNRVTLLDLSDPSDPRAITQAPISVGTSSASSSLRSSVIVGDLDIFVANFGSGPGDDTIGLETFRLRQTADRNADGVVNPLDLTAFIVELQQRGRSADLNGDGMVTAVDLNEFLLLYRAQAKTLIAR